MLSIRMVAGFAEIADRKQFLVAEARYSLDDLHWAD